MADGVNQNASIADGRSTAGGRLPDFFIVGHGKSGTTALYDMLRRHPQLYMPVKETWFFAPELRRANRELKTRPTTFEQYLALFATARPDQRVGEATPSYLRSHTAAKRIAEVQPRAQIVAILREPASFLRSLHLQFVQTHVETEKDLRKALALEDDRREGRRVPRRSRQPHDLFYADMVRYVEQLQRYHAAFPPEQVLVLIYDDFRADNEATVRRVLSHVEVNDSHPIRVLDANPTVRVRSVRLYELISTAAAANGPMRRVKTLAQRHAGYKSALAMRNRVLYSKPRPPDERLLAELRERFKPEVVAASEYLDRDLVSLWGYDRLD